MVIEGWEGGNRKDFWILNTTLTSIPPACPSSALLSLIPNNEIRDAPIQDIPKTEMTQLYNAAPTITHLGCSMNNYKYTLEFQDSFRPYFMTAIPNQRQLW